MGKRKTKAQTITVVKSHYIGEKSISEVFTQVFHQQVSNNYKKDVNLLKNDNDYDIISTSNLLSESEDL